MSGTSFDALKTAYTRVFLVEGRARGDHKPSYESGFRMTAVSQAYGDVTKIENPDPYRYGKYVEIGEIRGASERVTTSLEGRYAMNLRSTLLELAKANCAVDVQLHIGKCTDPSAFNAFEKAVIIENAFLTNWATEDLGNLASGDEAVVNETADVSGKDVYEVLPMSFGEKASSIVTNEILKAALCDYASCGDCEDESSGCEKVYAISKAAGGSPGTPPDVVFTIDGGTTWYAHDIDTLTSAQDPTDIGCLGSYVIVTSNVANSISYALKSQIDDLIDPAWTEITTGFVTGGEPNCISVKGGKAYIGGDAGYVYLCEDPTVGVTALSAGAATVDDLLDIDALSETFVVAVGRNGQVIYTENGESFARATALPVGVGINLNCVAVKNESEWWVGTSTGRLYYTLDGGGSWTEKSFTGSAAGRVDDIKFATDSVVYMAHATATPAGRILRSYDGGYSWLVTPERTGATIPSNDRINALVVCAEDPNWVVGVGLADNGSDGFVVVGLSS